MSAVPRTSRSRVLAASAALGVVAVMGGVPAAHADGGDSTDSAVKADSAGELAGDQGAQAQGASDEPSDEPSDDATDEPTADPTDGPTAGPTDTPTAVPTDGPTAGPTDGPTAKPTTEPTAPPTTDAPKPTLTPTEDSDGPVRAAAEPEPVFGTGKYRVGVKIASGAFVPPGTTTAGSQLTVTFSNGGSATCTTGPAEQDGSSFCDPDPQGSSGGTVTVTQQGANAGLVAGPAQSAPGCTVNQTDTARQVQAGRRVGRAVVIPGLLCTGDQDIVVTDTGTPPEARADSDAARASGESVDIDVLANDDNGNGAPVTGTTISSAPQHGSASFIGGSGGSGAAAISGGPQVRYTPQRGFAGTDTFRYTFSTANGSATGTVTVTVPAAPQRPAATPRHRHRHRDTATVATSSTTSTPTATTGALPDTGGPDGRLLGLGAALLGAGGVVTVLDRRRRTPQR